MRTRRRKNNPECVHCAFNCPSAVITARPRPGASKHCARSWPGGREWPRPRADPPSKGQGSEPEGVGAADNPPSPAQARNPALPQGPPQPLQPFTAARRSGTPSRPGGGASQGQAPLGGGAAGLTRQAGFVSEKDKRSHLRAQNHMWKVTEAGSLDVLMAGPGPRPPPGAPHGHGAGASTGEGKQRAPPDRGASRDSRGCEAGCW